MSINRNWLMLFLAVAVGVPAIALRLSGPVGVGSPHLPPMAETVLYGGAIVGGAFLLAWGAEAAQVYITASLALALVALVTVLPEYVVDAYFSWQAGAHPIPNDYQHFATANMTGANRLLIGLGWPLVALLFWFKSRRTLRFPHGLSLEIVFMGLATIYSFSIFLKGSIALWDAAVLIGLFILYMWLSSRGKKEEPELIGPAATVGALPGRVRVSTTIGMFLFAAGVILVSAQPFAEGLISTGKRFGIDEFLLVQWLAPLASEAPEFVVAIILTLRGAASAAMTALISAKVNQWTILVGSIPVIYSISLGSAAALPMNDRQVEEFFLTSAQSLFAVILLLRMQITWRGALALMVLFLTQLAIPNEQVRTVFAYIYLGASAAVLLLDWRRIQVFLQMGRAVIGMARGGPAS